MRLWGLGLFALLVVSLFPVSTHVTADAQFRLRIATLAPANSSAGRVFHLWNKQLQELSGGRVKVDTYLGGVAGDERAVLRKMKLGQLDGGGLTTVGLGHVVRPALVLSAPGVIRTYEQMNAVQDGLDAQFTKLFDQAGYTLLGFGDAGRIRYMSVTKPILRPSDLKTVRPWAWTDDAVYPALIKLAGANGIALGLPEVVGALQTHMVDTVPASSLEAVGLQWFNVLKYMTERSDAFMVGALIVRKEFYASMPPDLQKMVHDTAYANQKKIRDLIRREDDMAFETLKKRGVQVVDQTPYAAEWDAINTKTTEGLTGSIFPKELLAKVQSLTSGANATAVAPTATAPELPAAGGGVKPTKTAAK
jgi:TRAP-type C4-dicarboxylate transport system substrate-binding protein